MASLVRNLLAVNKKWRSLNIVPTIYSKIYFSSDFTSNNPVLQKGGFSDNIKVSKVTNGLKLNLCDREELFLDYMWLLDQCRCPKCYDSELFQKKFTGSPLTLSEEEVHPKCVKVTNRNLHISWSNEHYSCYALDWLARNVFLTNAPLPKPQLNLWDGSLMKTSQLPIVHYGTTKINAAARNDDFALNVMAHLVTYGFCIIEGVEETAEATENVIKRFVRPHRTFFGEFWNVHRSSEHSDSAYSDVYIPPHNDCTYLSEAPGLLIFHCLQEAQTGGETVLVDGFHACQQLKCTDPTSYYEISSTPIESCYLDKHGNHFEHCDTILRHHPFTHNILQLRFNPLDVAPIKTVSQAEVRGFYGAFKSLAQRLWDGSNKISFLLKPGKILVFDNWRVLHGRNAFRGHRNLYGCYVERSEFVFRARAAGFYLC